jgi:peptide deformylase
VIITDESLLRVKCEPVLLCEINDLQNKLDNALIWSLKKGFPGVGLACPQIGIAKQMAIVRIGDLKLNLVNANISVKNDPFEFHGEGCLSFPNLFEKTLRYKEIVVENNMVKPYNFIATDFLAIVISHEIDHLNGILLPDVAIKKKI